MSSVFSVKEDASAMAVEEERERVRAGQREKRPGSILIGSHMLSQAFTRSVETWDGISFT